MAVIAARKLPLPLRLNFKFYWEQHAEKSHTLLYFSFSSGFESQKKTWKH